jgi:hypothetical protein
MSTTQLFTLIGGGVYLTLIGVSLVLRSRRASLEKRLMRMSHQVDLPVPDHLEDELLRHIARRGRAWAIGTVAAVLALIIPLLLAPDFTTPVIVVALTVIVAGGAAASVGTALVDRRRSTFGTPTVARLSGPDVHDLVPLRPAIATAIFALAALVVSGATVVNPSTPVGGFTDLTVAALALAVGSLLGVIGWCVAARAIARSRPITGDATTLAWSDALRAESIRDLLVLPFLSAFMSLQLGVPALTKLVDPDNPAVTQTAAAVSVYGSLAIVVMMGLFWFDRRSAQHFKHRLWPALEHGRAA